MIISNYCDYKLSFRDFLAKYTLLFSNLPCCTSTIPGGFIQFNTNFFQLFLRVCRQSGKISTLSTGETLLETPFIIFVAYENSRGEREQSVSEYGAQFFHNHHCNIENTLENITKFSQN